MGAPYVRGDRTYEWSFSSWMVPIAWFIRSGQVHACDGRWAEAQPAFIGVFLLGWSRFSCALLRSGQVGAHGGRQAKARIEMEFCFLDGADWVLCRDRARTSDGPGIARVPPHTDELLVWLLAAGHWARVRACFSPLNEELIAGRSAPRFSIGGSAPGGS